MYQINDDNWTQVTKQQDQESQREEAVDKRSNNIDYDNCDHKIPPKPRLRQFANKQTLALGDEQQQQVSRSTELTSHNFYQVDGQQHAIRRQLDTALTTINTAGSQKLESDRQTLDLKANQEEEESERLQSQQRPATKVKPRVASKSTKTSSMSRSAADSDCIPKTSVRSLISRFS